MIRDRQAERQPCQQLPANHYFAYSCFDFPGKDLQNLVDPEPSANLAGLRWTGWPAISARGELTLWMPSRPRRMSTTMLPCNRISPRRRCTITNASEDIARLRMNGAVWPETARRCHAFHWFQCTDLK
jgi:hypothetical protein